MAVFSKLSVIPPYQDGSGLVADGARIQRIAGEAARNLAYPPVQSLVGIVVSPGFVAGSEQDVNDGVVLLIYRPCEALPSAGAKI